MNSMTLKGNWNMLKGKVREKWGKLTDNDMTQIEGRSEQLLGKLQHAYGLSKEEAQQQIEEFEEECGCDSEVQADEDLLIDEQDDESTLGQARTGGRGLDKEMD